MNINHCRVLEQVVDAVVQALCLQVYYVQCALKTFVNVFAFLDPLIDYRVVSVSVHSNINLLIMSLKLLQSV